MTLLAKFLSVELAGRVSEANAHLGRLQSEQRALEARIAALTAELPRREAAITAAKHDLDAALGRRARGAGDEVGVTRAREAHAGAIAARDQAREERVALERARDEANSRCDAARRAAVTARTEVVNAVYARIAEALRADAKTVALVKLLYATTHATRDPGLGLVGRVLWADVLEGAFAEPEESEFETLMNQLYRELPMYQPPA